MFLWSRWLAREVRIEYALGLHARPCLLIATTVRKHNSLVRLKCDGKEADAGNITDLLALGAQPGSQVTILAKGSDSKAVLDALVSLFDNHFGLKEAVEHS